MGDIKVGDYVFDAQGKPTKVLGVFPQGKQDVYRLTFKDGRQTLCAGEHLWAVEDKHKDKNGNYKKRVLTTDSMYNSKFDKGIATHTRYKYRIYVTKPVEYITKQFSVDPYLIGAFLGDGCCTESALTISSSDEFIVEKIKSILGAISVYHHPNTYSYAFYKAEKKLFQTKDIFKEYPELIGNCKEKRIPESYFEGSIEQRFALLQGLIDTDGNIQPKKLNNSISIRYATINYDLAKDVQKLCWSLGLTCNIRKKERIRKKYYKDKDYYECYYDLGITAPVELRERVVSLPRKLTLVKQSKVLKNWGNTLSIINIEKLNYQEEMVCIYVDNSEHLYLTNDYIVTHNTFLMVNAALEMLNDNIVDKIVWIRNNIDVKDTKDIGAIPGTTLEKLIGFLGPFIDVVGETGVESMLKHGTLAVEPLQFLRGRSFERTIIMCSESENLTREHIQLIIARAGEGSFIFMDSDQKQRDKLVFEKSQGVERMIESLAGEELFGYVHLLKSERSATASLADKIK